MFENLDTIQQAANDAGNATWRLAHHEVTADNAVDLSPAVLEHLARQLRSAAMVLDSLAAAAVEAKGDGPFGDRSDEVLANVLAFAKEEADLIP